MQPTEQKIQTSAGMETATETVNRIKGQLGQAPTTAIPVSAIETTAPAPLAMPTPQLPQPDIQGTRSAGQQILDAETQRAQEAVARTEAPITQSERQIREMFGILSTEEQTRGQLEDQAGVNRFSQDLQRFQESLRNQIAQLDQFDLDNVNTIEQMRVDASRRDITKRTFSAQSAEANIQMAVQRAGMVASTRATIAGIEATRGNLQAATEQVDKALKAIYEPVRMGMQMEMFFLERNDKRFDAAQKELANARMMGMQYDLQQIDRAEAAVSDVVANGYARPGEIEELISMSDRPQEQRALAQMIANRGASQMRELQIQQMQMSIAASAATLNARNQPDPMQAILMSLFDDSDAGVASFDDYVAARREGFQGPMSPAQMDQMRTEYDQAIAQRDPNRDRMQRLTYLVASGAISPQQADYIKANLEITSPQDLRRQQEAATVASTVVRDLNRMLPLVDQAGAGAQTLLDQIEARKGETGFGVNVATMFGGGRVKTRRMAGGAQELYDLRNMIDSVQGNISLETLQKMRENSPTGGALGNVSDKQSALLSSVLGNLELSQSPTILRQTINDIGNLMLDAIHGSPEEIQSAFRSGRIDYNRAQQLISSRYNASPEMLQIAGQTSVNGNVRLQLAPNGDLVPIK